MAPVRIGVIGAGIAGPVAAIFLKQKGYEPVVFERNEGLSDAGLGIAIAGNGAQVLAKIPGLLECIEGFEILEFEMYSVVPGDVGLLGITDYPKKLKERIGRGVKTYWRYELHKRFVEFAQQLGVEFRWGHKLETLDQSDDSVTATCANGRKETFSFLLGCDGLHSDTRACLFGREPATYTGISQYAGISPMPEPYRGKPLIVDIYGDGAHIVLIPVDGQKGFWGVSVLEPESKETWRATDSITLEEFQNSRFSEWPFGAGDAVKNCERLLRYGLYDRPELVTWHKGRVVLIGDAAHPTSPHLGQGANQSFEDIDLLIELLEAHNPSAGEPSISTLDTVFSDMEKVRIPRSAESVKGARKQGETRVVSGIEACMARNKFYREMCKDEEKHKARFGV